MQRIKRQLPAAAAIAGARYARLDAHRAAKLLRARCGIQRMQPVTVGQVAVHEFLGFGLNINRSGGRINYRRAGNTDFRRDIRYAHVCSGHGGDARARINEAHLPKRGRIPPHVAVRIERIHGVMFGRDIHYVMDALARNHHLGHDQWLGINLTIHGPRKNLAEVGGVYI